MVIVSWESILKVETKPIVKPPKFISLKDLIISNLKKYKKESIFGETKNSPRYFKLDGGELQFMRNKKQTPLLPKFNEDIVPEYLETKNSIVDFKADEKFINQINKLGKKDLGSLYYMLTGVAPPPKKTEVKEKTIQLEQEAIREVFGRDVDVDFSKFLNDYNTIIVAYEKHRKNTLQDSSEKEKNKLKTTIKKLQKNKGMLTTMGVIQKHISKNSDYKFEFTGGLPDLYAQVKLYYGKKNYPTFAEMMNYIDIDDYFIISGRVKNKLEQSRTMIENEFSRFNLNNREMAIIGSLFEAVNDIINDGKITIEEVSDIINGEIKSLQGLDMSEEFLSLLKIQFKKLIKGLGEVEGIEELNSIVDSFDSSSREFTYDVKKALNPKLASLPEEPRKKLKKVLQTAEPSEYFGQDYTRLGELVDLLQDMDFTKDDSELDEKIKSISEQNIDMVATAARLRKTYETLYLQVRKIVYPEASEGSLREEEEA